MRRQPLECVHWLAHEKGRVAVSHDSARTFSRLVATDLFPGSEPHNAHWRRAHHEYGAHYHRLLVLRHFLARTAASLYRSSHLPDPPGCFCLRTDPGPVGDLAAATEPARQRGSAQRLPTRWSRTPGSAAHPGIR